jgi:hypothetical protein
MNEKQFKKKKKRERAVQEKLFNRRMTKMKAEKVVKVEKEKQEAWIKLMEHETGTSRPFRKDRETMPAEEVKKRLEHNLKVLQALEEEFQRENPDAGTLKDRLEKAGVIKVEKPENYESVSDADTIDEDADQIPGLVV